MELACGFRYCVYLVIKYERLDFSFESDCSAADKMVPDSLKCSRKPLQNGKPHPWFGLVLEDDNCLTSFPLPFSSLQALPYTPPCSLLNSCLFFISCHVHVCVHIYS